MMLELRLQRALSSVEPLITAANLTYWLSQFAVVGAALLWIYLRRYLRIRDTIIVTTCPTSSPESSSSASLRPQPPHSSVSGASRRAA